MAECVFHETSMTFRGSIFARSGESDSKKRKTK